MDRISALMDGELHDAEARREIARIGSDAQLREHWDEFHLIGDALRGEPVLSGRFAEGLAKRLAEEPTVLAPRRLVKASSRLTTYALSAAASLSAAALVAWVALAPGPEAISGPFAEAPPGRTVPQSPDVQPAAHSPLASVPNDGSMNDYLLLHEGMSPGSSLQGVASYIRTVSAPRPGSGR